MYAQQIARARQEFPQTGQRPLNAGPQTETRREGPGGAFGAGFAEGASDFIQRGFIDPRVEAAANEYKMLNDPKFISDAAEKAWTIYQDMPDDLKERFTADPNFQGRVKTWVQRAPHIQNLFTQDPNGNYRFTTSEKMRLEREEASAKGEYYRSGAIENRAKANLYGTQASVYKELKGATAKAETEATKSYDMQKKEIPKIIVADPRSKMRGVTQRSIDAVGMQSSLVISLAQSLGPDHKKVQGEASSIAEEAFKNFNLLALPPREGWFSKGSLDPSVSSELSKARTAVDSLILNLGDKTPQDVIRKGCYMWLKQQSLTNPNSPPPPISWAGITQQQVEAYIASITQGGQ